jgi:hypothetical protein
MWPTGTFEASALSPAGEVQRFSALFAGLRSGSPRSRRGIAILVMALLGVFLMLLMFWGFTSLLH